MRCDHCDCQFEFSEDPVNAFVGYQRDLSRRITLCEACYHASILGQIDTRLFLRNFPDNFRPKHVPKLSEADCRALMTGEVSMRCSPEVAAYVERFGPILLEPGRHRSRILV